MLIRGDATPLSRRQCHRFVTSCGKPTTAACSRKPLSWFQKKSRAGM